MTATATDVVAQVRRAKAADIDVLVALRAERFETMGIDASGGAWRTAARAWFQTRLDHPDYGIFVVEGDGVVVASAVGAIRDAAPSPSCPKGRDVLINNVCTFPAYRGRGLGSVVFDAVLAWARETGVERAELMAAAGGRGSYEKAGFVANDSLAMRAML